MELIGGLAPFILPKKVKKIYKICDLLNFRLIFWIFRYMMYM